MHTTLKDYYGVIFSLVQMHKYNIADIENLMPFERDLYVDMLAAHLETRAKE